MTFEDWKKIYKPGKELQKIPEGTDLKKVWTIIFDEYGECIVSGFHFINQDGYYITEIPYEGKNTITIEVSNYYEEEEY